MLARLIAVSLERSGMVLALALTLVAWAGTVLDDLPVDVFPELNAPTVVVLTEAGGLGAEEVEQRVTWPIESTMTGLPGVRRVRSASALGLSIVWVEFDWQTEIYLARQLVTEKLAAVEEGLPAEAHAEIGPVSSITGEIMLVALSSPDGSVSPLELRELAEFTVRPRLMAVPGISQVVAIGGELPEYQVHVRQGDLLRSGLSLDDVVVAAERAQSTRSAGYLANVRGREQAVLQQAQIRSPRDVRETLLFEREEAALTIGDVAEVRLGGAPKRGTASAGGRTAVVMSIQKAPGTNTLELTEDVDEALVSLEGLLPRGVVLDNEAFRQATFIGRAVDHVTGVLRDAVLIVSLVLLLFLMSWRTTLITLTALPLSLAVAVLALDALGLTLNVMTLGGLAVAIGELVDDAIIDVENVHRRLRDNAALPPAEQRRTIRVVYEASNEIRSSVVFATIIICVVFLPLLFLEGLEGRFFLPLGLAYITAILASLAVALTVTPAMCLWLLRGEAGAAEGESWVARRLKAAYDPALAWVLERRRSVVVGTAALTVAALGLGSTFGASFLPEFSEGTFTVFLMAPPGTSLDESDRLARGVEGRLAGVEGVRGAVRRTGRAERDEHAEPVWSSEIEVTLEEGARKVDARAAIDLILADMPGITTMVGQPIEHRLSHILSGTPAAIAISFFGEELPVLREVARDAEAALRAIEGTRDVTGNREAMVGTLPIHYRHQDLARWGLTPATAAEQVGTALAGARVATVRQGPRTYDLVVRLHEDERRSRRDIEALVLRGASGQLVRLGDVATVAPAEASVVVARENARRKAVVSCNVGEGHNLGHLVEEVKLRLDPIAARHGVAVHYGGQFEAEQAARRTIVLFSGLVLLLVLLLLTSALESMKAAALVLLNLPLGMIGGIGALFITGGQGFVLNAAALLGLTGGPYIAPVVSVASMVGFVTLFGIAVRGGILLVNHYARLQEDDGLELHEAIVRGSHERLLPILMTALTAVLGLLPLALGAGEPGSELLAPLAIVVLGGLASATVLNLFVVPAAYSLVFQRTGFRRRERIALEPAGAAASSA